MCKDCVKNFSTIPCLNCEEKEFKNEKDFCEYLFTERNKNGVCLSHYGKGYDTQFVVRYLLENNKTPNIIATGTKFLSAEYKAIRLLDSFSFMPMKLSDLPKSFGFSETTKGYFPHLFNTEANQNYVGPIPDPKFYNIDGMTPVARDKFLQTAQRTEGRRFRYENRIKEVLQERRRNTGKCSTTLQKNFL